SRNSWRKLWRRLLDYLLFRRAFTTLTPTAAQSTSSKSRSSHESEVVRPGWLGGRQRLDCESFQLRSRYATEQHRDPTADRDLRREKCARMAECRLECSVARSG